MGITAPRSSAEQLGRTDPKITMQHWHSAQRDGVDPAEAEMLERAFSKDE